MLADRVLEGKAEDEATTKPGTCREEGESAPEGGGGRVKGITHRPGRESVEKFSIMVGVR